MTPHPMLFDVWPFQPARVPSLRPQIAPCNHGLLGYISTDLQNFHAMKREWYQGYQRYTGNVHARGRRGHPYPYYLSIESAHAKNERKKTHTSCPRVWLCNSSGLTDAAGNGQLGTPPPLSHLQPALPVRSLSSHVRCQLTRTCVASIHCGPSLPSPTATYVAR